MPSGEIDVTDILNRLGDPNHGLVPKQGEQSDIFRASYGEIDMSTSVDLKPIPPVIWDVNRYYRDLGISWPYQPTRRQLWTSYMAQDGQSSQRLTYYLKQLINPEVRARYDATPLGKRFYDKYVEEENMQKLADFAAKESTGGKTVTVKDLVEEYAAELSQETPEDFSDIPEYNWDWGYYTLHSRMYDPWRLVQWQELLIRAFAEKRIKSVISIGYIGDSKKDHEVHEYEGRWVFFLNENKNPTMEQARSAVAQYVSSRPRKGKK